MAVMRETLASYVPRLVRRSLAARGNRCEPTVERFGAAVLFADITGFTKLTERLPRHGASGQEALTGALNAYFEPLIELIAGHGGDIAKMAGDALIALWSVAEGEQPSLEEAALRASQCGLAIQGDLSDYE